METDLPCSHNDNLQKIPPVDNDGKKDEALISPPEGWNKPME
jgi:hypothetical protein